MRILLVDNGSLRAESVLNLRRVAGEVGKLCGREVLPSSLLHSSKVPAEALQGEPAVNFERRLRRFLESGETRFTVLPFFFGPSAAITEYLPRRVAFRRQKHGPFRLLRAPFLCDGTACPEHPVVRILGERVRETLAESGWERPKVVLVDHGSPLPEVTAVRNRLGPLLAEQLGDTVREVTVASMERREGDAYAFNEPLLAHLLDQPGWNEGQVIVSMLFLSPGRHAGPGGDIDTICRHARERHPGLECRMTGLVGDHPLIVPLLGERLKSPLVEL